MTRLDAGVRVDVLRGAGLTYRDRLRELDAADLEEASALRDLVHVARGAEPIATDVDPEAWHASAEGHAVVVRVIRWRERAIVVDVSVREPGLGGATVSATAEVRGLRGSELAVALWYATPVDTVTQPERWRARSRLDDLDVSLVVERRPDGSPLVTHAVRRGR